MNHPKTMSIGGATFDLFVRLQNGRALEEGTRALHLPIGAKIGVEQIIETCGGGASNTAVGLSRLGCAAAFCGVVGNDQWGERMLENLRKNGVETAAATVVEGENSSSSIILSTATGERSILYNAGSNIHLHDVTFDREQAAAQDWLYLTHLQTMSCEILDDVTAIAAHAGLTWNPGSTQVKDGWDAPANRRLLARTRILLLNKEEALGFTRARTPEDALRTLAIAGARIVCITDGPNGALATDGNRIFACPALPGTVVDTTGAGDAFGTGLTWAIASGLDLPTALRTGTINATSVLEFFGAQEGLLTNTEMTQRLSALSLPVRDTALRS